MGEYGMPAKPQSIHNNGRPKPNLRILQRIKHKCQFCQSSNMNTETLTCNDCNTSVPGLNAPRRRSTNKKADTNVV